MAFELRNNTPFQNKMLRGNNIYYTKASMVTNDGRTAALLKPYAVPAAACKHP